MKGPLIHRTSSANDVERTVVLPPSGGNRRLLDVHRPPRSAAPRVLRRRQLALWVAIVLPLTVLGVPVASYLHALGAPGRLTGSSPPRSGCVTTGAVPSSTWRRTGGTRTTGPRGSLPGRICCPPLFHPGPRLFPDRSPRRLGPQRCPCCAVSHRYLMRASGCRTRMGARRRASTPATSAPTRRSRARSSAWPG
jgi:hypothetical protein